MKALIKILSRSGAKTFETDRYGNVQSLKFAKDPSTADLIKLGSEWGALVGEDATLFLSMKTARLGMLMRGAHELRFEPVKGAGISPETQAVIDELVKHYPQHIG